MPIWPMGPFWSRADAVDLASDTLRVSTWLHSARAGAHAARRLSVAAASGRQCPASSDRDLGSSTSTEPASLEPRAASLSLQEPVPPWRTRGEPARSDPPRPR